MNKKGGTIRCLSELRLPPSDHYSNKQKQLTPYDVRLLSACSRYRMFGGIQVLRTRAKAQISSISTNRNANL